METDHQGERLMESALRDMYVQTKTYKLRNWHQESQQLFCLFIGAV